MPAITRKNPAKFIKSPQAAVAPIFALMIVPLILLTGFAIDLQRTFLHKQKVQAAMDGATLAAGKSKRGGASDEDAKDEFDYMFSAQLAELGIRSRSCEKPAVTFDEGNNVVAASISCDVDTTLLRLGGRTDVKYGIESASKYGAERHEVAFMFDLSTSMLIHDRLSALKVAALDAVDILLPEAESANQTSGSNIRLAMVTYNEMIDAGPYFETVTGVPATRTYTRDSSAPKEKSGNLSSDWDINLYDTKKKEVIEEIGDGSVVHLSLEQAENLTVVARPNSKSFLHDQVASVRQSVRRAKRKWHSELDSAAPFTLFGEKYGGAFKGREWTADEYTLSLNSYENAHGQGRRLDRTKIDFTILIEPERDESITISSTCVWERDGDARFSDAAPGPGRYLAHQEAWWVPDSDEAVGGRWEVGHREKEGHKKFRGNSCRDHPPVKLTNKRADVVRYIRGLTATGYTGGHLGVAWTWYLLSDNWENVFRSTSTSSAASHQVTSKTAILMTDGAFNNSLFTDQGTSDQQARALCKNMKNAGITIYTVAFSAPPEGKAVLEECATSPDHYYAAEDAEELMTTYREIANSILSLSLSK